VNLLRFLAVAWSAAHAQPTSARRIGMLEPGAPAPSDPFVDAFRDGMRGLGYKGGISFSKFAGLEEATNRSSGKLSNSARSDWRYSARSRPTRLRLRCFGMT